MTAREQAALLNKFLESALAGNFDSGDDRQALFDDDFKVLYTNIHKLIESEKQFVSETQVASSQIMSASDELSLTLGDSRSYVEELTAEAKRINALNNKNYQATVEAIGAIKDIITNIDGICSLSQEAQGVGAEARQAIDDGITRIYQIIELIDAIESSTKKTVEYVGLFTASTGKITKILKVVHDIARETEILSFNASIESKRAGVEGRGFGVIAGSIRDLAEKSRREVLEIGDVISDIESGLKNLTDNINSDYDSVQQSVEHTKTVEASLNRIKSTFGKVQEHINGILSSSRTQTALAAGAGDKISGVEENSAQVNSGFNGIYDSIKMQKKTMESLDTLGRYLVDEANVMSGIVKNATFCDESRFSPENISNAANQVLTLFNRAALNNADFVGLDPQTHTAVFNSILNNEIVEAVWSNEANGRFIVSNPPAGIKNARVREWFKQSIEGRQYISDVYISAITKKPCITVSVPIKSGGAIVGVLGADLRL